MRKSKNQIRSIGRLAIIGLIAAILLEFRAFYFIENIILQRVIFLRGHRDFVINILIGCSCSAIVVIACEYLEYLRLNKELQNQIDRRLKGLKSCLETLEEPKCLEELVQIIYVFLTIFLYLLKCPQSLILSALRAFCFCGKPHISRSIFLYFLYQTWLKSW